MIAAQTLNIMKFTSKKLWSQIVILLLGCICNAWAAEPTVKDIIIRQSKTQDITSEDYYFYRLLELALRKTDADWGKASIKQLSYRAEDKRLHAALIQGKVDILWAPTSEHLEQKMLPVRISLLKDLNNYRLLLIRKHDQPRFSAVHNLDDLRKLTGGMSSQWVDADIMTYNKLPLVQAVGYGKLFKMLAAKRFDYYSRGLYQIQSEVDFYPELELEIEQDIMLSYPNYVYFFVHKNNNTLAERITQGLKIAQQDGSFDQLFNSIPRYQWGLNFCNIINVKYLNYSHYHNIQRMIYKINNTCF